MYTVARFISKHATPGEVLEIGQSMNALKAGMFTGIRLRGDGFASDICRDGPWPAHARAIREFISEFGEVIRRALDGGMLVTIDIAIEDEDKESAIAYVGLGFSPDFLLAIGSAGIGLEITSY